MCLEDAIELAEFLRDQHMYPEQVQDFIPTPGAYRHVCTIRALTHWMENPYMLPKKGRDKAKQRAFNAI